MVTPKLLVTEQDEALNETGDDSGQHGTYHTYSVIHAHCTIHTLVLEKQMRIWLPQVKSIMMKMKVG